MSTMEVQIEPAAFDTAGAALYVALPKKTMEWRRFKKLSPNYVLIPGTSTVRYLKSDLDAFLNEGHVCAAEGPNAAQKKFQRKGGPGRPPKLHRKRNRPSAMRKTGE